MSREQIINIVDEHFLKVIDTTYSPKIDPDAVTCRTEIVVYRTSKPLDSLLPVITREETEGKSSFLVCQSGEVIETKIITRYCETVDELPINENKEMPVNLKVQPLTPIGEKTPSELMPVNDAAFWSKQNRKE